MIIVISRLTTDQKTGPETGFSLVTYLSITVVGVSDQSLLANYETGHNRKY